jgi:hypothetical protein
VHLHLTVLLNDTDKSQPMQKVASHHLKKSKLAIQSNLHPEIVKSPNYLG